MKRLLVGLALLFAPVAPALAQTPPTSGFTTCASSSLSVTNASANTHLSGCGPTVVIWNLGTAEAFVAVGATSSAAATTANQSIPAGKPITLNVGLSAPYLAAITASSTATLRISQGYGTPGLDDAVSGSIPLTALAPQAANTVVANSTSGVASPTAVTTLPTGLTIPLPTIVTDDTYIYPNTNRTTNFIFDQRLNTDTTSTGFGLISRFKNSSGVDTLGAYINPGCSVCGPTGSEVGDIDLAVYNGFAGTTEIVGLKSGFSGVAPNFGPSVDNLWTSGINNFAWKSITSHAITVAGALSATSAGAVVTAVGKGGNVPVVLGQTHIPFVLLSSGTMGNNGALSAITAVAVAYPNAYCYVPAGAIATSSLAGWYYCTFASTTTATLFNNTYDTTACGTPTIPGSPTAFSTTGPGNYTQTTAAYIGAYCLTVPANSVGVNGSIEALGMTSMDNSAGAKNLEGTYGAFVFGASAPTASTNFAFLGGFSNRGVAGVQTQLAGTNFTTGAVGGAPAFGAVDSTQAQTLTLLLRLATLATDTQTLETAVIQLLPGVP